MRDSKDMHRLKDQVMIITGAASGIGSRCAAMAAAEGAAVVLVDRAAEAGASVRADIERADGRATFVAADITDEDAVAQVVSTTVAIYGGVTSVFNCAGVWRPEVDNRVTQLDRDAWLSILDVNLTGTFLMCKHAIAEMLTSSGGSIVNVASAAATHGQRGVGAAYTASKGGVLSMSRLLACDLASRQIRVNCICPGPIRTELTAELQDRYEVSTPIGRTGLPEDIGHALVFLSSSEAAFVTGTALAVDGGVSAQLAM